MLNDLASKGKLDARLHEWANDVLRTLGNDAAHNVGAMISEDDARDALEFTKALIQNLFVLQRAFDAFKKRRAGQMEKHASEQESAFQIGVDEDPDPTLAKAATEPAFRFSKLPMPVRFACLRKRPRQLSMTR